MKFCRSPYAALGMMFVLSRLAVYYAGVRFDAWVNVNPMHFIFPELMKTDLWRSLFCLHSQPPLFNLFVGSAVKVFPSLFGAVFAVVYLCLGLCLILSLYRLMTVLGTPPGVSLVVSGIFMASPACILYENILMYTYPVAVLLCLAGVSFHAYAKTGKTFAGLLFFSIVAALVLTRSLFHVVWFAVLLSFTFMIVRDHRTKTLVTAIIPLLMVLAVYGKNACLFGTFSVSSWMGASFAKVTTFMLPEDERIAMVARGELSELALLPAFSGLWLYHDKATVPRFDKTGVPVLDLEYWPSVGNNYNNLSYRSLSDQYFKDAVTVLKKHPGAYLAGLKQSLTIYCFPASDWFISRPPHNMDAISPMRKAYDLLIYGRFAGGIQPGSSVESYGAHVGNSRNMGFLIIVWYILAVGYGVFYIIRGIRRNGSFTPETSAVAFMVMTIVYVTLAANMVEVLENMRFRFNTEPLAAVLIAMWAGEALKYVRRSTHA